MRTAIRGLEMFEPASLDEAFALLRDRGPLVPLAGCTDVYVSVNAGTEKRRRFLNLWGLDELRGIDVVGDRLRLGALTTYTDLIRSSEVQARLPMLAQAAALVGGAQIQNRGTLGGNLANGSPAGDTLPVLAVAQAEVILGSASGQRTVPFNEFYTGYRQTALQPDELVVALIVPPVNGRQWFCKVGTRQAQAISKVVMAGLRSAVPRLALGSVGPTVVRLPRTEAALAAGAGLDQAERELRAEIHPMDDIRSTATYRRRVAVNLLCRFWAETA